MNSFVFTCGDINGIGPEISLKTINNISKKKKRQIYFVCPKNIFLSTLKNINIDLEFEILNSIPNYKLVDGKLKIIDIGYGRQSIGKPTKTSGKISYASIITSYKMIENGIADAMVTAPISKFSLGLAGIDFPGHTELLAKFSKSKKFGMMFLSSKFHTALLTIHEPIAKVARLLSQKLLINKIDLFCDTLKNDLKIANPKMALLGINPHSGENGKIGNEEIKIFNPVLNKYKSEEIQGPFVPDAFFGNRLYKNFDLVIGTYHDQVLIPFKLLNFNQGVNFTAGLPFVRTSPDHGTAFDIAYKNIADYKSMYQAFIWAEKIVNNRKNT